MTLELQGELSDDLPFCEIAGLPSVRISKTPAIARVAAARLSRPNGHERRHAVPQLIAANPPVPEIEVTDYESLVEMLRRRADSLEISRSTIDRLARYPDGYSAKILTLTEPRSGGSDRTRDSRGAVRRIGLQSLGPMLDALAMKLIAVPDVEAFERNRSRYVKRDDPHFRSARRGHDGKPGKKFKTISGTVTARLFGWPAP